MAPEEHASRRKGSGTNKAKPRWIRCIPLLGSDDMVGVWMVISVPVAGDVRAHRNRSLGMRDDKEQGGRKMGIIPRSASRATSITGRAGSSDSTLDGGFGKRRRDGSNSSNVNTKGEDESQLYAEYSRSSSQKII